MNLNKKNWKLLDIFYVSFFFCGCFFTSLGGQGFIVRLILFSLIMALGFWCCSWYKRIKAHKKRTALLSLSKKQMKGFIMFPTDKRIGSTYKRVEDGESFNIRTGDIYIHSHAEEVGLYEGYSAIFQPSDGQKNFAIEALPRSFWGNPEPIPEFNGSVILNYVTDSNGINYFVSASHPDN